MKSQDPLAKNLFNLKGWIIANGIVDFNYDGFVRQAPEVFSAFNVIPRYLLDEVRENKCEYWFRNAFPERQEQANPLCDAAAAKMQQKTEDINKNDLLEIQKIKLVTSLESQEQTKI
jgi:hypothetical protein